jgi:DNA-binding CsgD family transcriptional regulator
MGAYKGKILDVLELYKEGHTIEQIAKSQGLTVEEVKYIIEEFA